MTTRASHPPWEIRPGAAPAWGWFLAIGGALALLAIVAAADLFRGTLSATYVVATAMSAAGLIMLLHAFYVRGWIWTVFWLASGLLYMLAAASTFRLPIFAAQILSLWLMIILGWSGAVRIGIALGRGDSDAGGSWVMASGIVSIGAAITIAAGWFGDGVRALGSVMLADLFCQGATLIITAGAIRAAPAGRTTQ